MLNGLQLLLTMPDYHTMSGRPAKLPAICLLWNRDQYHFTPLFIGHCSPRGSSHILNETSIPFLIADGAVGSISSSNNAVCVVGLRKTDRTLMHNRDINKAYISQDRYTHRFCMPICLSVELQCNTISNMLFSSTRRAIVPWATICKLRSCRKLIRQNWNSFCLSLSAFRPTGTKNLTYHVRQRDWYYQLLDITTPHTYILHAL